MTVPYIVYLHTCKVTGKSYVGWTGPRKKDHRIDFTKVPNIPVFLMERRWNDHVAIAFGKSPERAWRRYYFQDAIKKHGVDAWEHTVLCDNISSKAEALDEEHRLVAELGTLAPAGYNGTRGGKGIDMNDEAKERHRLATKEALNRPDVKKRICAIQKAAHNTPEFLERNSAAQKIAQIRPEVRELKRVKMKAWYDTHCSPVARYVEQLDDAGNVIATYCSATEASYVTGTNYTNLTEVARGVRPRAGGFRWRYVD